MPLCNMWFLLLIGNCLPIILKYHIEDMSADRKNNQRVQPLNFHCRLVPFHRTSNKYNTSFRISPVNIESFTQLEFLIGADVVVLYKFTRG